MTRLLKEIRHNPLLWPLAFVPVVLAAQVLKPEAHTLLFVLSVVAIVPLAALLSRATESVAARTGDMIGGLLNATLGNLTELLIALAALRAGQYVLVKASIAGAIVTNALFMLGASFLLGGLKHHVQEYNRNNARLQAGLLFLATIAMLVPSVVAEADTAAATAKFSQTLSTGLSVLLIVTYGLGLVFSLKTHGELFASADHAEPGEAQWSLRLSLATLAGITVLVALVSEVFVEFGSAGRYSAWNLSRVCRLHYCGAGRWCRRDGVGIFRRTQKQTGPERGHCARERVPNRALRRTGACPCQLRHRPDADEFTILAGRRGNDTDRDHDRGPGQQYRSIGVVRRGAYHDRVSGFRHDALSFASPGPVKGSTRRAECVYSALAFRLKKHKHPV